LKPETPKPWNLEPDLVCAAPPRGATFGQAVYPCCGCVVVGGDPLHIAHRVLPLCARRSAVPVPHHLQRQGAPCSPARTPRCVDLGASACLSQLL